MATQDKCCSIVPYFNVSQENLTDFRALCEQFVEKTSNEEKCLYYGFCFDGNTVHCREGYADASGVLAHLDNVGALLEEAMKIAEIIKLEIHGPAEELDLLREPLKALAPQYFVLETGFRK